MEPNERERIDLGERIAAIRLERFEGSRKAAYGYVDVNAGTWDKAEKGERLAERSLVRIVKKLWPESGGDWRKIDPPLGGGDPLDVEEQVRRSNLSPVTKDYIVQLLRGESPPPPNEGVKGA